LLVAYFVGPPLASKWPVTWARII